MDRSAGAAGGRKGTVIRTAQYGPPSAAGTNSSRAISPLGRHRKVIVLQNLQYRKKVGLYSREQKGYAGSVRKTASEAVARCVLLPFPMRLAHFGRRIPASVQSTPLRPASNQVPQLSSLDRDLGSRKIVTEDRLRRLSVPKKTPLIATCTNERRSGFETSTPSPASTLSIAPRFFRSSLLQTEGRFSRVLHQFGSMRSTLAPKGYANYFNKIQATSKPRLRAPAPPPVSV